MVLSYRSTDPLKVCVSFRSIALLLYRLLLIVDVPAVSRPGISTEIQTCQGTPFLVGVAGLEPAVGFLMSFAVHAVRYSCRPDPLLTRFLPWACALCSGGWFDFGGLLNNCVEKGA